MDVATWSTVQYFTNLLPKAQTVIPWNIFKSKSFYFYIKEMLGWCDSQLLHPKMIPVMEKFSSFFGLGWLTPATIAFQMSWDPNDFLGKNRTPPNLISYILPPTPLSSALFKSILTPSSRQGGNVEKMLWLATIPFIQIMVPACVSIGL